MKKRICFNLTCRLWIKFVCLFVTISGPFVVDCQPITIHVMSYNIRYDEAGDGENQLGD